MTKTSQKINLSSLQVLKTLQTLFEDNFTMQELVTRLNINEKEAIFNNSIISKYINTCRFCGFNIPKINNRYVVAKIPFGIKFSTEEIDLIERLTNNIKENLTNKQNKLYNSLISKLNRYSNKKIIAVSPKYYENFVELFERAVTDRRMIKLILKSHVEIIGTPIKIIDTNGKSFFHIFCRNKDRMVDVNRVSGIEVMQEKFIHKFSDQSVVFILKGKLAKRYQARENETVMQEADSDIITVSNRGENKEVLLSRLLRYDDLCEIISPKSYREEMAQLIEDTLANYGEN